MLFNLYIREYANQKLLTTGIDSPEAQIELRGNSEWFDSYPYEVNYCYNSRGYRDNEWPSTIDELKKSIWCVGDSFTAGIGVKFEHTWPYILQQQTSMRTVNISMDGASNGWIAARACEIISELSPANIVIHWSYTHRREKYIDSDSNNQLKYRLMHNNTTADEDIEYTIENMSRVESIKNTTNVIHSFIPNFHEFLQIQKIPDFHLKENILYMPLKIMESFPNAKIIPCLTQLDIARDMHHYGKLTADKFVDSIVKLL